MVILTTAEELFAKRGIAAVPLRDIGIAAGQKNNVAVQYHFGDRDNVLTEITTYRAKLSEEIRAELLADLFSDGRPPTVSDLVRVWIVSLASHLEEDNHYLAFLSRYVIERGGYGGLEGHSISSTHHTLTTILRRLWPETPEIILNERWTVMSTSVVHTLARYQTAQKAGRLPAPLADLIGDLVNFFTAALEAPSEPTPDRSVVAQVNRLAD
jgi:AcrR family transcriptional regulator